ncbi:MAG: thioredoxin family protein [Nitrososphaeria archaeon]|nr:thioredoxin family protein [Nitrososphaeria archaeon]
MPLLSERIRMRVKEVFDTLPAPVKLIIFTQEFECETCVDVKQLAEELSLLSNKVKIEIYDFVSDKDKVEKYEIDKIPAIVVEGEKDYGIRFYGLPGGYEFNSLLHAIKIVSSKDSGLSQDSRNMLKSLSKPVHIQVFVTLTCPYCPMAVETAHKLALESDLVKADMVDATEFPHLANKYQVFAVPKVVINDRISFEGALPELSFVRHVLKA